MSLSVVYKQSLLFASADNAVYWTWTNSNLLFILHYLQLIAASTLYLAGKIKDDPLKIRDIINVTHNTLHRGSSPLEIGEEYWNMRDGIVQAELLIMRILKFEVSIIHPHKYMLHYLKSMEGIFVVFVFLLSFLFTPFVLVFRLVREGRMESGAHSQDCSGFPTRLPPWSQYFGLCTTTHCSRLYFFSAAVLWCSFAPNGGFWWWAMVHHVCQGFK